MGVTASCWRKMASDRGAFGLESKTANYVVLNRTLLTTRLPAMCAEAAAGKLIHH